MHDLEEMSNNDSDTNSYSCPLFVNASQGETNENVIVNVRVVVAAFSFLGSLFVLSLIWLFKKYNFFTQRLILYTSFTALISSVAYILGRFEYEPEDDDAIRFCRFSGFFLFYSDWTVLLATLSITVNLLVQVACRVQSEKFELGYLTVIFGFPLLFVWIPFTEHSFGPSGAWCWIESKNPDCSVKRTGKILQLVLWYAPLYIVICALFLMYLFIVLRVKFQVHKWYGVFDPHVHQQRQLLKDEIKPLLWYPMIYFCVQLFPVINRIVIFTTDKAYFSLFFLHVATSPLTGTLIALAYALDRETMRRLNWKSIRINLFYRSTDQVVHPYAIKQTHEEEDPARRYLMYKNMGDSDDQN